MAGSVTTSTLQRTAERLGVSHLRWIPGAAGTGFLAPFLLSDRLRLSATGDQLLSVILVGLFLGLYVW